MGELYLLALNIKNELKMKEIYNREEKYKIEQEEKLKKQKEESNKFSKNLPRLILSEEELIYCKLKHTKNKEEMFQLSIRNLMDRLLE